MKNNKSKKNYNNKTPTYRKSGEWKINSDGWYPYCSECFKEPKGGLSNYCPNCGAFMKNNGK